MTKSKKAVQFRSDLLEIFTNEWEEASDEFEDRQRALRVCLKKLTPKDTQLIQHRYWRKGTLQSLADATNRSTGTLKARLFQLRNNLKKCIENQMKSQA